MGSNKELNCCGQVVRFTFVGVNIFFFIVGFGLIGLGIYLLVVGTDYSIVTGTQYASGAVLLLISGFVTCLISAVGVLGGLAKWWGLLLIYFILLIIVIVVEIIAGILGFVYQGTVSEQVTESLDDAINSYRESNASDFQSDVNSFVDTVQTGFECCGVSSPNDWLVTSYYNSTLMLPASCNCVTSLNCTIVAGTSVYSQGCNETFFEFIQSNALIIGACGIVLGVVEIVGVFLSLVLCCCLLSGRKSHEIY